MNSNYKQTVLITGASSGIGLGLTKGFLAAGFNVVANSRRVTAAGTLTPSDDLLLVDGDVGDASTARKLIDRAEKRFGRLDVLINNAGIFVPKAFVEYTTEDFQRVVSTNLGGFFYVTQEAVRHMQRNGGGQIITISTTLAQQPVAGVAAALTNLTKGGLNSATRGLAIEYAAKGIRVNAIAPGIVDTPFWEQVDKQFAEILGMEIGEPKRTFTATIPLGRIEQPEDVTGAAVFLASADSDYITQQTLNVDGGNWPS